MTSKLLMAGILAGATLTGFADHSKGHKDEKPDEKPTPVITISAADSSIASDGSTVLSATSSIDGVRIKIQIWDNGNWVGLNGSGVYYFASTGPVTATFNPSDLNLGPDCYSFRAHGDSSTTTSQADSDTLEVCVVAPQPTAPPNTAPVAVAAEVADLTVISVTANLDSNTINKKSKGNWLTAYFQNVSNPTAPVTLDGTGSSDAETDSEDLSYTWNITGDNGYEDELSGATQGLNLAPGSYTAVLTVSDGDLSSTDTIEFTVSVVDLTTVAAGDITLNGVAGDWGQMIDASTLMVKFNRTAAYSVLPLGEAVQVNFSGAVDGSDVVRVINR